KRSAGLAEQREVVEAVLALRRARRPDEIGRTDRTAVTVIDAEAPTRVDELEREARAQALRRLEDRTGRGQVSVDRGELRARVRGDSDETDDRLRGLEG